MPQSQQRLSNILKTRRRVFDDGLEPVQIYHGIEPIPIAAGLEQFPAEDSRHLSAPQVVLGQDGKETFDHQGYKPPRTPSKLCGLSRRWFWILLAVSIILVAIAVAATVAMRVIRNRQTPGLVY